MSDTPTRFPLAWPAHKPRTPAIRRKSGTFGKTVDSGHGYRQKQDLSIYEATRRLEAEVDRLGGTNLLISSNVETRLDGRPRGDRAAPADPGVAVYLTLKAAPYTLACDTFDTIAQNLAALAAHIEATRKIERLGVATAAEALQAFAALPPPPAWDATLGVDRDSILRLPPIMARGAIETAYRHKAAAAHPDRPGGSHDAMARLNAAKAEALKAAGA